VKFVRNPEKLPDYKQLSERRAAARRTYPKSLREKLVAHCGRTAENWTFDKTPLRELLTALGKEPGVPVKLDEKLDAAALPRLWENQFTHAPLDKALDVICLELGLTWIIAGDGSVLIEPAE
jgi:hypothetical protein